MNCVDKNIPLSEFSKRFSVTNKEILKWYNELEFAFFNGEMFSSHLNEESIKLLEKLIVTYPDFVMGKLIKILVLNDKSMIDEIKAGITEKKYTSYDETHCQASIAYMEYECEQASRIWSEHLLIYPKDLIALRMGLFANFFAGKIEMPYNLFSRSLPHFEKSDRSYGYLLNFLAFGLEETNFFELADKTVKEGLALAPSDCMGIHVQAHVYESLCRYQDGIEFLEKTENCWKNQFLGCHIYWHLSLFYVELGNFSKALEIFDNKMLPKVLEERTYRTTCDAVQLLYRLEFDNVSVMERWNPVCKASEALVFNHSSCFYLVHVALAQLRAKNNSDELLDRMEKNVSTMTNRTKNVMKMVGMPIIKAFVDHSNESYKKSANSMYGVRDDLVKLGASKSQLDFFELLLFDSCSQCEKHSKEKKMGKQLIYERQYMKKYSPMTERISEKF